MNAERLMFIGGSAAFALTVYWVRNRKLRERYAIGWLLVATILLISGLFPSIIMRWAESWHLSYPSAVLFIALAAIYCFSFFVTVSLTLHHRRDMRLMQESAILKHRLEAIEAASRTGGMQSLGTGTARKDGPGR
jgi:hypothetical protein